jgi:DNA polymerase-1
MDRDTALDKYLSYDVATTAICAEFVINNLQTSQQESVYNIDVKLSRIGRSMSAIGLLFDKDKRLGYAREYQEKANRLDATFRVMARNANINPRSVPQLKKLFYEELGLPIMGWTDTGEPSTAEPVLLELLAMGMDKRATEIIHALLGYREADKILGTYTGHPNRTMLEGGLPSHPDGRIRTTWKYYGTPSGRSSSSPNLQNIPYDLREMFVPAVGHVFVQADYSALELRLLALLSGDGILIKAFADFDAEIGPDIHVVNACTVFGCTPEQVTKDVRDFAKRFVYALAYGAMPPKIFQTMSLLRNEDLSPVFPGLELGEVKRLYKAWWKAHPDIINWRKRLLADWRRRGYIATPWHGRRRYFLGGEDHEQMYNHPIQGAAGDLKNEALINLADIIQPNYEESTGIILDGHDALMVECRKKDAQSVAAAIEHAMYREIGPMKFPAKAKIGDNWKEVS